jgi:hypothetical protein
MGKPVSIALWPCAAAVVVCSAFIGCGSPENVGQVSGKVTLDGHPLAGARVRFTPKATGSPSSAITDASGNYSLVYTRDINGAEIGEHTVSISTYSKGDADAEPPKPSVPEKVPAKYNTKRELTRTVKAGSNTINFELESTGKIVQPGKNEE